VPHAPRSARHRQPELIALALSRTAAPHATAADAVKTHGLDKAVTDAMLERSSTSGVALARQGRTPLIDQKRHDATNFSDRRPGNRRRHPDGALLTLRHHP